MRLRFRAACTQTLAFGGIAFFLLRQYPYACILALARAFFCFDFARVSGPLSGGLLCFRRSWWTC